MKITHKITMDLDRYAVPGFDAVCGDRYTRELEIALYAGGTAWKPPAGATVTVRYQKPDGTAGVYDLLPDGSAAWSISGNVVTVAAAPQTLTVPGCVILTVCLTDGDQEISTFQILMNVRPAVGHTGDPSEDYWHVSGSLPQPENPVVGEVLVVDAVDSQGRVTGLRTGGGQGISAAQIRALENLLKLAVYAEDPTDARLSFLEAFGLEEKEVSATGITLSAAENASNTCLVNANFPVQTATYSITYALTGVDCSRSDAATDEGSAFTAELTAQDGYVLDTVSVTMGGADVTQSVYADGVVAIGSVTGTVVIIATAKEISDGTLLYNWDFTNSLADTVSGAMATPLVSEDAEAADAPPVQDSTGVHFTGVGQALDFDNVFALGRTYEIDVAEMDYQATEYDFNMRLFTLTQGNDNTTVSGFLWSHSCAGWAIYSNGWGTFPTTVSDRNVISGKTVKLRIGDDGSCEWLLDDVSYGTATVKFTEPWSKLHLGSVGETGYAAQMGALLYHCTITGFRIYQGVV